MANASALAAASSLRAGLRTELRAALAQIEAYPVEHTWRPAFLTPLSALPLPRRAPLADRPGARPPVAALAGGPLTIAAARHGLHTRTLTAADLLQAVLEAIESRQRELNASVYILPAAELREQAAALDAQLRAGVCRGVLHGIPLVTPELIDAAGMPAGGSASADDGHAALADAGSVRLLRAAGAIMVGQVGAAGAARNGVASTRRSTSEEGSEGGAAAIAAVAAAAAAVAGGMALGAPAPDACGSLHAATVLHGIASYKPTFGLVPNDGAHLRSWSIDQVGCVAATVEDVALLLDVLDPAPHVRYSQGLCKALRGVRIGVPVAALAGAEAGVAAALQEAAAALRQAGAEVAEIETPDAADFALARAVALVVSCAEAAAYLSFGARPRRQGDAPPATPLPEEAARVGAAHYLQAQRIREDLRWRLLRIFDRCDALLLPVAHAPTRRSADADRLDGGAAQNSVLGSLLGFPTVMLPCGRTPQGLAVGAELVAAPYEDARLLAIAAALEVELR